MTKESLSHDDIERISDIILDEACEAKKRVAENCVADLCLEYPGIELDVLYMTSQYSLFKDPEIRVLRTFMPITKQDILAEKLVECVLSEGNFHLNFENAQKVCTEDYLTRRAAHEEKHKAATVEITKKFAARTRDKFDDINDKARLAELRAILPDNIGAELMLTIASLRYMS